MDDLRIPGVYLLHVTVIIATVPLAPHCADPRATLIKLNLASPTPTPLAFPSHLRRTSATKTCTNPSIHLQTIQRHPQWVGKPSKSHASHALRQSAAATSDIPHAHAVSIGSQSALILLCQGANLSTSLRLKLLRTWASETSGLLQLEQITWH